MRYSSRIKPISYLKANAAEVPAPLSEQRETQETLALLKILALGSGEFEAGQVKPVHDVVARLRAKRATD